MASTRKDGGGTKGQGAAPAVSMTGVVESDKQSKSRKVVVRFAARHPKYGKYMRRRTSLHVHDENNESRAGDVVEVTPCRPMSASKTWRLLRVVKRQGERA